MRYGIMTFWYVKRRFKKYINRRKCIIDINGHAIYADAISKLSVMRLNINRKFRGTADFSLEY